LVGGVCAALATHFNWDVSVMRAAMLAIVFLGGGVGLWIYGVLWLMTPFEATGRSPGLKAVDWLGRLFSPPRQNAGHRAEP
jgi:phage shock protein PspC (stress-responsive transcriptional regulator)